MGAGDPQRRSRRIAIGFAEDRGADHAITEMSRACGAGLGHGVEPGLRLVRCLAAGHSECPIHFDIGTIVTPQLVAAFAALGALALVPVVIKRLKGRHARSSPAPLT